jgi:predicted SnoaL-like aldol condensation-catalyzing enzyme
MKIVLRSLSLLLLVCLSLQLHAQGQNPLDYEAYVRDFNSGDDDGLVEKYFAEDTVMISASGSYHGHEGMKEFLAWAHDGVREILRPISLAQDERNIFVEVDMDFVASKPRPDFPFGNLQPGDIVTVKFLAHYTVNEQGKITQLQTMTWEPERGVSKLPRLGVHPGQQAAYIAYSRAFSAGLADRYSAYYPDDVELELPSVGMLRSKQAIVDFYTEMFKTVREDLEINNVLYSDNAIIADVVSVFTASSDAPDFSVGPLKAGESYRVPLLVYYDLQDGLISRIRVARLGNPQHLAAP